MNDGIYEISTYIECRTTYIEKVRAIDALISAFELKLVEVGDSIVYDEYEMNDGQMKVRTKYRNSKDVLAGIDGLEKLKQRYLNRVNGRTTILRSGKF